MNNVQKFFSYLGFNDTSIDSEQILKLIHLLSYEQDVVIKQQTTLEIVNSILDTCIDKMETNGFKTITEQQIIAELST